MTRRRTHDRHHLAGFDRLRRRRRHVGVDVPGAHRDPDREPGPPRRLGGQRANPIAELGDRALHLVGDEVGEVRVERPEELARRIGAVLEDGLVAGGARVADVDTA